MYQAGPCASIPPPACHLFLGQFISCNCRQPLGDKARFPSVVRCTPFCVQVRWDTAKGFHVPELLCKECSSLEETLQVRPADTGSAFNLKRRAVGLGAFCGRAGRPSCRLHSACSSRPRSRPDRPLRCCLLPSLPPGAVPGGAAPPGGQPRDEHGVIPQPLHLHRWPSRGGALWLTHSAP